MKKNYTAKTVASTNDKIDAIEQRLMRAECALRVLRQALWGQGNDPGVADEDLLLDAYHVIDDCIAKIHDASNEVNALHAVAHAHDNAQAAE